MRSAVWMHRLRVAAMVVFVVLLAAQLTLHNHSLIPEGSGAPPVACSVCAFGADPITLETPLFGVMVLLGLVAVSTHSPLASGVLFATSGRAPPPAR